MKFTKLLHTEAWDTDAFTQKNLGNILYTSMFRFPLHNVWTWATVQNHGQGRFVPQKRTCAKVFVVRFISVAFGSFSF